MSDEISKSPDRNSFQQERYLERKAEEGRTPENDDTVAAMMEFFKSFEDRRREQEADPAWRENNMEYDLRSSAKIVEKCRQSQSYSQNLYAALCNTEWQKLDVMPILRDESWSCSWRYAGGIVSDLRGEGDYIDWYCSGIGGGLKSNTNQENFVGEATVTDEIRADFLELGWQQFNEDSDE